MEIVQQKHTKSDNYKEGKLVNLGNVNTDMKSEDMLKAISGMFKTIPNATPNPQITIQKIDSTSINDYNDNTRFIWFDHSAFLVQKKSKILLYKSYF